MASFHASEPSCKVVIIPITALIIKLIALVLKLVVEPALGGGAALGAHGLWLTAGEF